MHLEKTENRMSCFRLLETGQVGKQFLPPNLTFCAASVGVRLEVQQGLVSRKAGTELQAT